MFSQSDYISRNVELVHKIISLTTEIICLQGELPIILITTMNIETFIKKPALTPVHLFSERYRRKGLKLR